MTNSVLTILLSHERSGSHLLGELLSTFDLVTHIDEVCNVDAMPPAAAEDSFIRFRNGWASSRPDYLGKPSRDLQLEMCRDYFDSLRERYQPDNVVVDIKYGHVHNFESFWWPITRCPLLFEMADTTPIQVIHLSRDNVLEAILSAHIAEITGVWHSWQETERRPPAPPYQIDANRVVQETLALLRQVEWVREFWIGNVRCFEARYEQLVRAIQTGSAWLGELSRFVGSTQSKPFRPEQKKLGRPPHESVANYEDLVQLCQDNGLAHFLT